MSILDFVVYGFVYGLIGAAGIALVVGIVTLAIECYKEMGVLGLVANVAAWAGFFGGFVVPIVFISNPALFLVVLIGGIAVSNTLMFFAMGEFKRQ